MKKILFIVIIISLFSCSSDSKIENFNNAGISFDYPSNWRVIEEGETEGGGYYIALQKRGRDSNIVTIDQRKGRIDLKDFLNNFKNTIGESAMYGNLNFKEVKQDSFKNNAASSVEYDAQLMGENFKGIIYCFYTVSGNTLFIIRQTGDKVIDDSDFNIIVESFRTE